MKKIIFYGIMTLVIGSPIFLYFKLQKTEAQIVSPALEIGTFQDQTLWEIQTPNLHTCFILKNTDPNNSLPASISCIN